MTDKPIKPVAKSLHTVTVLVQVARLHLTQTARPLDRIDAPNPDEIEKALDSAMSTLGLTGREDPWNTRAAALKQLQA